MLSLEKDIKFHTNGWFRWQIKSNIWLLVLELLWQEMLLLCTGEEALAVFKLYKLKRSIIIARERMVT